MDTIFRTFEASIDSVLDGERAVVARINTAGVDRLKTVIDPLGCDVSHFNKTRSVLWNHGLDPIRGTVPIGSGWAKVRRAQRDMIGKTSFAKDEFSNQLFESYKDGTLRGWSIKAGVHQSSPPTQDELRAMPELEGCEMVYRKWDLIEFSATPTPGNSDCLTMLVSRGLITPPQGFYGPLHPVGSSSTGMCEVGTCIACDQNHAEKNRALQAIAANVPALVAGMVKRYITGSGDSWTVHAEDGKVLGHHKDKASAEKQLAAIEVHKHDEGRAMPWIDSDGQTWTVYHADGQRCISVDDPEQADECLRLLVTPADDFAQRHLAQSLAYVRQEFNDYRQYMREYIDLFSKGRV